MHLGEEVSRCIAHEILLGTSLRVDADGPGNLVPQVTVRDLGGRILDVSSVFTVPLSGDYVHDALAASAWLRENRYALVEMFGADRTA